MSNKQQASWVRVGTIVFYTVVGLTFVLCATVLLFAIIEPKVLEEAYNIYEGPPAVDTAATKRYFKTKQTSQELRGPKEYYWCLQAHTGEEHPVGNHVLGVTTDPRIGRYGILTLDGEPLYNFGGGAWITVDEFVILSHAGVSSKDGEFVHFSVYPKQEFFDREPKYEREAEWEPPDWKFLQEEQ